MREKQQPLPLEGELMSVEDVCKLLGKSKSAVYRTVRCHDIPFIRQGNRSYFDRPTIKKWLNDAAKLRLNPQIPRKVDETKKPVSDWQLATFQNDYDPYRNPWMV